MLKMKDINIMTFEEWYEKNEEELRIMFAETGMDRELDFDIENELEKLYEKYLKEEKNNLAKLPKDAYEGGHY